ncbi:MAG: GTPase/DUF3482 domain-containing protein [Planctomycetes bacterium]|nr:GTPase/DUF3482 domain-containing protein [Planctomycetota bacterium]
MTSSVPVFVVVGNVNQGKSSVVAALSENSTVPIDSYPGTTIRSGTYVFRVGDRELFRMIDTPGFQEPRRVLEWLRNRASHSGERSAAVRAFVAEHEREAEFRDEVELLRPILDGAGILYVVDASARFQPANEAEMEVLRWTGQPGMALLNRTRDRDHADEWRPVLNQFFNIVRSFDAHGARFADRVALLRGFREIRPEWAEPIDVAVAAMEQEWADRQRRAARLVADLMIDALGHVERRRIDAGDDESSIRAELLERLRKRLREVEAKARTAVEELYRHRPLDRADEVLDLLDTDLFSEQAWRLFGLTRAQLAKQGAIAGFVTGGAVDAAMGGWSFLTGAMIGTATGAAAGWFGGQTLARTWGSTSKIARRLFPDVAGRFVGIGPVTSSRFAWVLLDRALVHLRAVMERSHARQDALAGGRAGVAGDLEPELRKAIDKQLQEIVRRTAAGRDVDELRPKLAVALLQPIDGW